jgi:inosine-uridine nucleoside N-ribohydrolase
MSDRLAPPRERLRLLIDTDAANEIDDQFALAWALRSPKKLRIEAVTAEPYSFAHHLPELRAAEAAIVAGSEYTEHLVGGLQGWLHRLHRTGRRIDDLTFAGPEVGMKLSFDEILRDYDKLSIASAGRVFRGADRYMTDPGDPVVSEAAEVIIDLAKSAGGPLYIAALGCPTNIASAMVMAPEIIRNIVVVWTSAYPTSAPHCNRPSLNLVQDTVASRILFDSGVPHIYLPGYHVGAQLKISQLEMERYVKGRGAIGDYLHHLYTHNPLHHMFAMEDTERRTWVIWDMINIAWLINPEWVPTYLTTSPILSSDLYWQNDPARHAMREAFDVQRDEIFMNFYDCLPAT